MEAKKNPSKDLQQQSSKFFLIGLCVSVTLAITAFEWRTKQRKIIIDNFNSLDEPLMEIMPTTHEPAKPQPIPIQKTINIIKKSETLSSFVSTKENIPDPDFTIPQGDIKIDSGFYDVPLEPTIEIFTTAELMPKPVGGYELFYSQLSKVLKYPRQAQRSRTEGKVFVEFVIDKNGNVTAIKTIKGIGNGCDEEAMRVLAQTRWQAGKQRGVPVNVRMTMPINFKLE